MIKQHQYAIQMIEEKFSMLVGRYQFSKTGIIFVIAVVMLICLYMRPMFFPTGFVSKHDSNTVSLKELLVAAIQAAERGGDQVKKIKQEHNLQVKSKGETQEGVVDPVTLGDMHSHREMYYSLVKMFPNIHIVSEERSKEVPDLDHIKPLDLNTTEMEKILGSSFQSDVRSKDVTIWIDPLDATKEYTEDLLEYVTTMVCVAYKGAPVIGVIHRPFQKQTIWAWKGHGRSSIPDFQTSIDDTENKDKMKVIVSLSHAGSVKPLAQRAFGANVEVISAGGAGYKSLFVAQRKANAYIHSTAIKKWDICAGNALLNSIGGAMTDLHGGEVDYSFPTGKGEAKLHDGLLATYKDHKTMLAKLSGTK